MPVYEKLVLQCDDCKYRDELEVPRESWGGQTYPCRVPAECGVMEGDWILVSASTVYCPDCAGKHVTLKGQP